MFACGHCWSAVTVFACVNCLWLATYFSWTREGAECTGAAAYWEAVVLRLPTVLLPGALPTALATPCIN